jgi:hypothetical protein
LSGDLKEVSREPTRHLECRKGNPDRGNNKCYSKSLLIFLKKKRPVTDVHKGKSKRKATKQGSRYNTKQDLKDETKDFAF